MRSRATPIVLVAGAVVIGLSGYWYFNPQSRPAWVADKLPIAPGATVELYRWKNDSGQWTVSDKPPPKGIEYETVEYRHDENVMPAVSTEDD